MKVFINNEQVVCDKNIKIKEEILNTSSTILNKCYPLSWKGTDKLLTEYYYPKDYSKCLIYDDNNNMIFCGVVKRTGNINLNPSYPHYCDLEILDFKTFLSEGETLDFVIYNKTIQDAITQVISAISDYGFILGNIQILNPNDIIGAYSTQDKTAYDVLQYLSSISQSKWSTRIIDENTIAIDFYDPTLMPQASPILSTKEYCSANNIVDISYSYSASDYRNKQIIKSSSVYSNIVQTESIISNGYQTQYPTDEKIGKISSITIDGVIASFATNIEKDNGLTADFYYTVGNNYFESTDIQIAGKNIVIKYYSIIEGRQIVINSSETNRIKNQTGRKGIIARYESRNDATTSPELQAVAENYIKYKGTAEIILTIKTHQNDLFNIGQTVNYQAPIDSLTMNYMVKTKTTDIITSTGDIFYTYELSSNYNSENAINYFDNQRNKAKGNIGAGEYITRNIDIESPQNIIFYGMEIVLND